MRSVFHLHTWVGGSFHLPNGPQPYDIKSCGIIEYCLLGCVELPLRTAMRVLGCIIGGVVLSVFPRSCCCEVP